MWQEAGKADDEHAHLVHGIGAYEIDTELLGIVPDHAECFADFLSGDRAGIQFRFQLRREILLICEIAESERGNEIRGNYCKQSPPRQQEDGAEHQIDGFGKYCRLGGLAYHPASGQKAGIIGKIDVEVRGERVQYPDRQELATLVKPSVRYQI